MQKLIVSESGTENKPIYRIMSFPGWLIVLDVSVICLAVVAGYVRGDVTFYFGENRIVTWLSTAQLLLIALYCALIFREIRTGEIVEPTIFASLLWLVFAGAFFFAALDEFLMIHENIDFAIHGLAGIRETAISDRLDDFIVFLYAVVAASVLFLSRRELVRFVAVKTLVLGGFAMAFTMIGLDALTNRHDLILDAQLHSLLSVTEDTLKIAAESAFLVAAYRCWRSVRPAMNDGDAR